MSGAVAVVSTQRTAARARATVRSALGALEGTPATVHVLDADGTYPPVGAEPVHAPEEVGLTTAQLRAHAIALTPVALERLLRAVLVRGLADGAPDGVTVSLAPGVVLLRPPAVLVAAAREHGVALVTRPGAPPTGDRRRPSVRDLSEAGEHSPAMLAVRGAPEDLLGLWEHTALDPDGPVDRWLDIAAATVDHTAVRDPAVLLSRWNLDATMVLTGAADASGGSTLALDGHPVVAVDLTRVDSRVPWLLDPAVPGEPRARLSDHPPLARLVADVAAQVRADEDAVVRAARTRTWDPCVTALGTPLDPAVRALFRSLPAGEHPGTGGVPDPFDPADEDALLAWLAEPAPDGSPGRYLMALHRSRPDLRDVYAAVPGADVAGYLTWVAEHAVEEGYAAPVVAAALERTPPPPPPPVRRSGGVNVVGFLRGELGIGESARLLVGALRAADVPFATVSVDQHLASRQNAPVTVGGLPGQVFDTSILCVNADHAAVISRTARSVLEGGYRIGMWYWEVEEFPASQHGGFAHVDEVWVATEFVRAAVAPHAPVPVHVVPPPLPQRPATVPSTTRADLGLPDGPLFLFSFDHLSTMERKNPLGLLEAFSRAFRPGEGPVLVLKSINGSRRPADAERLRLAAAARPDVVLLEEYLDADQRDALVALCDCYVSLHRSEGLGLTIAEAMAWGKPVIATGYSGNLQFMTADNAVLVPFARVRIGPDAAPYPADGVWAEPDLDAAAAAMRRVLEEPERAAALGARAAADIAGLHDAGTAGRVVAARLAQIAAERSARHERRPPLHTRAGVVSVLRRTARRTLRPLLASRSRGGAHL